MAVPSAPLGRSATGDSTLLTVRRRFDKRVGMTFVDDVWVQATRDAWTHRSQRTRPSWPICFRCLATVGDGVTIMRAMKGIRPRGMWFSVKKLASIAGAVTGALAQPAWGTADPKPARCPARAPSRAQAVVQRRGLAKQQVPPRKIGRDRQGEFQSTISGMVSKTVPVSHGWWRAS